nr:NADH dehydrogenase subunit 5 [Asymmetricata circumdata]
MSICLILFIFLLFFSFFNFMMSLYFMMMDLMIILEYELMSLNSNVIYMSILLDWMSLLIMSFVLFISSMVIFYSSEYMTGDLNMNRFIYLVFLFVMSMMFLIISPNLISILLGWDGLGLVSYCLVIYYQNSKSLNYGMLTALSNRIGDVGILMSIAWMMNYGSWNFIFYLDFMKEDYNMKIISYFVVLSALTKSAEIPFSSWLPAAMAAPTPASSHVHSSTLVTAGVYLLIGFKFCFSIELMFILLVISSMTMFMSRLIANFEYDFKKIIAFSTLSQLGLMMSNLALGDWNLSFFHLLTHALFKALLFMCGGCMIHNFMNCQDIRYMGALVNHMPLTCIFFNISNFSLCGLPFLSGFYSKDLILEIVSMSYFNMYMYMIFYFSIGLTVYYSLRLCYYLLFSSFNFYSFSNLNDQGYIMLKGMSGLIFFVIIGGGMLSWLMFPTPYFICLRFEMKILVNLFIFMGLLVGNVFSRFDLNYELKTMIFMNSSLLFSSMFNMTYLSTYFVNFYFLKLSGLYDKKLDLGWSQYFGSLNLYNYIKNSSGFSQLLVNSSLKIYLILFIILILLLMI